MLKLTDPKLILLPIIFLVIIFLFLSPLIIPLNRIVVEESYLQFCSFLDLNLFHLIKDHKIPFWAYHFSGGYPFIKHPENLSTSPLFYLFMLPFGSAVGLKLLFFSSYCAGAFGMFLFASRIMKYDIVASTVSTVFFLLNSFIPFQINTGNLPEQLLMYLPLIAYTLFLSKEKWCYVFYSALLIALVVSSGFSLYYASLVLFLLILVVLDALSAPDERAVNKKTAIPNLFMIIVAASLLAAIKLLPLFELLKLNMRAIDSYEEAAANSMTFGKMFLAFFSKGPYAVGNEILMGPNGLGMGAVMYVGVIPAAFLLASAIFCFREIWKHLAIIAIFLVLSMANNSPWDLFYILWHLPFFHSMHEVARYFSFPAVFSFSIAAGAFFSFQIFRDLNKSAKIALYALAIIGAMNMFFANRQYFKFTALYQKEIPQMRIDNEFFNVETVAFRSSESPPRNWQPPWYNYVREWRGKISEELPLGLQYFLLRQNIGLVNSFMVLDLPEKAVPRYFVTVGYGNYWSDFRKELSRENGVFKNEEYKQECHFLSHSENKIDKIDWRANEIRIFANQIYPDTLIINQNYDWEWVSDAGKVYDANGLIGLILNDPAQRMITLRYHPRSFYVGAALSAITLLACFSLLIKLR